MSFKTFRTFHTWDSRFHAYPVARPEMLHIPSCLLDDTCCLMAKYEWEAGFEITDRPFCIIVEIRTADSHSLHPDKHIIRSVFRNRDISFFNLKALFASAIAFSSFL